MDNYLDLCEELCISIITFTSLDEQMEDPKAGGMTVGITLVSMNQSVASAQRQLLSFCHIKPELLEVNV